MKFLNLQGLEHLISEIKLRFVQKTSGKDLSTNDFTNLFKNKLDKIESDAQVNKIELIKKNGTNLSIDSAKAVDITIPTKISDLTNDKNYVTQTDLGEAGLGDMLKSVYDTNNDGVVDRARVADSISGPLTWGDLKGV